MVESSDFDDNLGGPLTERLEERLTDQLGDQINNTNFKQGHDDIEIRMRCPSCYKLYSLDSKTVYVDKPEFDCVSCEQKFWISFPEALEHKEIVAFPIEWSEHFKSELQTDSFIESESKSNVQEPINETLSPKLVEKIAKNFAEVPFNSRPSFDEGSNSVLNSALNSIQYSSPNSQINSILEKTTGIRKVGFVDDVHSELTSEYWFLEKSWDKVLNNYDIKSIHKEFIHSARAKRSLDFALGKYKNFCEANGQDQVAKEMKFYCEKLIQDHAIHNSVLGHEPKGYKKFSKYIPWFVISLSAGLIGLGFSNEGLSDLAGFGFALIFLTGALSLLKESDL